MSDGKNAIVNKTFKFAADILDLNTLLIERKQFVLTNQLIVSANM